MESNVSMTQDNCHYTVPGGLSPETRISKAAEQDVPKEVGRLLKAAFRRP